MLWLFILLAFFYMMSSRSRSGGASSRVWGRVWRPVCVKAPDIDNVSLFVFFLLFYGRIGLRLRLLGIRGLRDVGGPERFG